jgi:acyl carrier protein
MFATQLKIEVPSPETDLLNSGMLDSLGLVDLLVEIEKQFGFSIPIENLEVESFRSVATIANQVAQYLPKRVGHS